MNSRLIFSQLLYIVVLGLYFFVIKLLNSPGNDFGVVLFDYPRHAPVLYFVFLFANLFSLYRNKVTYSRSSFYPFIFFWLPFLIFLLLTAILFFYGFVAIGAPFRRNVFVNLFIAHAVAFILIRTVLKRINR